MEESENLGAEYTYTRNFVQVKVKVKFTLEQVTKAQMGSSYGSTLSLTSALDVRWMVNATSRPR